MIIKKRAVAIFASLILSVCLAQSESPPLANAATKDCVVLLHGLGRSSWSIKRLEHRLERENYRVINLSYASTQLSIEEAAAWLDEELKRKNLPRSSRIHFVTHSQGGIVLRRYFAMNSDQKIGRVVMLAPPNQGSELADRLKGNFLYRFLTGPSGQQLGTSWVDLPRQLPPATYELGVVAGDRSLNPLFSAWIPGRDDGKVSVVSTRLAGMNEHLVVQGSHTWLPWREDVSVAVVQFLQSGSFAGISAN